MPIFLTGATGYIGGYIAAGLLRDSSEPLYLLVRAPDAPTAEAKLWRSLQLHMDFATFRDHLARRITPVRGDLAAPGLGLAATDRDRVITEVDSVIHCAAALNRRSEKTCLNVNLRGTLAMIQLTRAVHAHHGVRRYSHVSTVAVCGHRQSEVVSEDSSVDWQRSDYDPYARTKKFCELMVTELLADVPRTIFRPSIVLGDSTRPETTQFDMVRAFAFFAGQPILPFRPDDQIDIVPVNYVANAVATIHQQPAPMHGIYHLSSGRGACTFQAVTTAIAAARGKRGPRYAPRMQRTFERSIGAVATLRSLRVGKLATLLQVFMPYLVWNTVFDNERVVAELGTAPAPFTDYCMPLLEFSHRHKFRFPYTDWPTTSTEAVTTDTRVSGALRP